MAGHVTGPNQYKVWVLEDAGGIPGTLLGERIVTDLDPFGSSTERSVDFSSDNIQVQAGQNYWVAIIADGAGQTWGAANYSNNPGLLPMAGWRVATQDWVFFGEATPLCWMVFAMEGGGGFNLSVEGDCPGRMTASTSGATPGGTVAYVFGLAQGSTTIPGGPCAGTQLGIQGGVRLVGTDAADGSGNSSLSGNAPAGACRGFLQALDVATCTTSNVAALN